MQAIIIEDNPAAQALLAQVTRVLWPDIRLTIQGNIRAAIAEWDYQPLDLLLISCSISDAQLPVLIQTVRKHSANTRIVLLDDHADRNSVLLARRSRIDSYLIKPIQPSLLLDRLRDVFSISGMPERDCSLFSETLDGYVRAILQKNEVALPIAEHWIDMATKLRSFPNDERNQHLSQLAQEPALVFRLLGLVNSGFYVTDGSVIENFTAAVDRIGIDSVASVLQEIGLYPGSHLSDPALQDLNSRYRQDWLDLRQMVIELRRYTEFDVLNCKAASLFYRCGELVVLQILQRWIECGGDLSVQPVADVVKRFSADAGNRIKTVWQLPMAIRMRIGASYQLPQTALKRDSIAMRAAGLLQQGGSATELDKLLDALGIGPDQSRVLKDLSPAWSQTRPEPAPEAGSETSH